MDKKFVSLIVHRTKTMDDRATVIIAHAISMSRGEGVIKILTPNYFLRFHPVQKLKTKFLHMAIFLGRVYIASTSHPSFHRSSRRLLR